MATLSAADLLKAYSDYVARLPSERGPIPASKAETRAMFTAIDQYMSDNEAAMNAAIPQPARSVFGTKQKALALMCVVARRYGVL